MTSNLKNRERQLKSRYGITVDQYNQLLEKQDGHCALCPATTGWKKFDRPLHVDHDHITGKVRGLLCSRCNLVVGVIELLGVAFILNYLSSESTIERAWLGSSQGELVWPSK